jgi:hypothetical protein
LAGKQHPMSRRSAQERDLRATGRIQLQNLFETSGRNVNVEVDTAVTLDDREKNASEEHHE